MIVKGASWSLLAHLTPVVVSILLTPFLIRGFGVDRYGVLILTQTVLIFFTSFDGGVAASATRFFAIHVSRGDRFAATRLTCTLLLLVAGLGVALLTVLFFAGPSVLQFFNIPAALRSEGEYLIRLAAFTIVIAQLRSVLAALMMAHQRYAWQSITSMLSYSIYPVGYVLTIEYNWGLRGAAWVILIQSLLSLALVTGPALRLIELRRLRILPWPEMREFLAYAFPVQASKLIAIINNTGDTFVVGRLLSVSAVAIYGPGASFASQLRSIPSNALGPMAVSMSHAAGSGNHDALLDLFTRLQRKWTQAITAWCSVAIAAAYFGVAAWLGPGFETSGQVAGLLMIAHAVNLWTGPMTILLNAAGRPAIELRYTVVAVVLNLALTVPLVIWFGILGTVVATSLGAIVGSLYLVVIVRKHYDARVRSFIREIPVVPALATIVAVVIVEFLFHPIVPEGALGLVVCGLVSAPGFAVYGVLLMGPGAFMTFCKQGVGVAWRFVARRSNSRPRFAQRRASLITGRRRCDRSAK